MDKADACINPFPLFQRRQEGRAYIKNFEGERIIVGCKGVVCPCRLTIDTRFLVLLHDIMHCYLLSQIFTCISRFTTVDLYRDVSSSLARS